MNATIKKLDARHNQHYGDYVRVHFELENGGFAMTDIVPTFRNASRWKPLLKIGNVVGNVTLLGEDKINADSPVVLVEEARPDPQLELFQ